MVYTQARRSLVMSLGFGERRMIAENDILRVLDKPRRLTAILTAVDPGGRTETLQTLLMQMRERGQVRFDIKKGTWSRL